MIREITLKNLGTVNQNEVIIITDKSPEKFSLFFSYKTLVGIWYGSHRAVIENLWSRTTGKLLNYLEPDKKERLSKESFDREVDKMMKLING